MAFTDHSDLFGSVHEDGMNLVVRHIMRQRPSLFNYATPIFGQRPDLFCEKIEAAPSVLEAANPLFTQQKPLTVLGTPFSIGVNFCVQLRDVEIDFHPGETINLPSEFDSLSLQRFSLRMRACAGVDCPSEDVIDRVLPRVERHVVEQQLLVVGDVEEEDQPTLGRRRLAAPAFRSAPIGAAGTRALFRRNVSIQTFDPTSTLVFPDFELDRGDITLPITELLCFCLELFAVGHFEWGTVPGFQQQFLKPKLDGIEIVDLQPTPMENAIECYLSTMLRLGILPRLMVPMEKMILDVTEILKEQGLQVGQQVNLQPAAVPGDVPNNPAVEDDQVKAFIQLTVTEGGV